MGDAAIVLEDCHRRLSVPLSHTLQFLLQLNIANLDALNVERREEESWELVSHSNPSSGLIIMLNNT